MTSAPVPTRVAWRTYRAGRSFMAGTKIHAMQPRNRWEPDVFVPLCGASYIAVQGVIYDDQDPNACHRCHGLRHTQDLPAGTVLCKHCGGLIEPDPDNDWVHTESDGVYCGLPVNAGDDDTYYAEPATP